jgi:hypothetical protein
VVLTRRDLSKRFETSLVGEAAISAFVTVVVLVGVVWNLPDSEVKRTVQPTLRPAAAPLGLEQGWAMYAPNPITRREVLEVRVTMSDGQDRVWTFDRSDYVGGPLFWYHWQKFKEQVIRQKSIQSGLADWVVRELTDPDEHPRDVEIILRTTELKDPGDNTPPTSAVETLYQRNLGEHP